VRYYLKKEKLAIKIIVVFDLPHNQADHSFFARIMSIEIRHLC